MTVAHRGEKREVDPDAAVPPDRRAKKQGIYYSDFIELDLVGGAARAPPRAVLAKLQGTASFRAEYLQLRMPA
jgi:hypothetical protein